MVVESELSSLPGAKATTHLHQSLIQRQFQKIIASPEFLATKQQRDFFSFVISETLAGRSENLKGYDVATQVLGRSENFDSSVDPIVSIQANKLRRALERYYLVDGRFDPIRIDIPKGGYTPTFVRRDDAENQLDKEFLVKQAVPENSWPTILILPFENLTGDPEQDFLGSGISTELAIEVSRFENMRVLYPRGGILNKDEIMHPRFVLKGQLYKESSGIKLAIYLIDTQSGMQIWGDTCQADVSVEELFRFKERVVHVVASEICGEFGVIPKTISKETKNKEPHKLSTYEAILRFWEYEQNNTPEKFRRAYEALSHAVRLEPDCSQALGSLAIMYSTIHNLKIPGFDHPLEKAIQYVEKAAVINPNNQRMLAILALIRLTSNELSEAIKEAHKALAINPESLFVMDGLGWVLTLSGDWKYGPRLAEKAISLNPYHRTIAHDALWVNYIRQEKYDFACKESYNLMRSELFWDSLIKASSLGLVGRDEDANKWVIRLLELRPDFPVKGRQLIGNFIKFEEITERILLGLNNSGLAID